MGAKMPTYSCADPITERRRLRREIRVTDPPPKLNLRVTDRCDLDCAMCGQAERRRGEAADRSELAAADLDYYLRTRTRSSGGRAYIWGGEPLLHADLAGLIAVLRNRGFRVVLGTSGSRLPERAASLPPVDEWIVSIDGPPRIHDRIRGFEGLFDRVMAGVDLLRERDRSILVANLTISELNQGHIEETARILDAAGFHQITLQLPTFTNAAAGALYEAALARALGPGTTADRWKHFQRSYSGIEPDLLAEQVEATLALLPGRVHMFPYRLIGAETFRRYFADPFAIVSRKRGRCLALGEEISIEPDGSIVACPDFPDADLGHITEAPWPHPWKTDKMARLREAYRSVDFGICARCCRFF